MFLLFAMLLAGQEPAAFLIYYAVLHKNPGIRRTILDAIAKDRELPKETREEIDTLRKDVESLKAQRNEIVHALWAYKEDRADTILAVRSNLEWVENFQGIMAWNIDVFRGFTESGPPPGDVQTVVEFWEFTLGDFDELISKISVLIQRALEIHGKIASHSVETALQPPPRKARSRIDHLRMAIEALQNDEETSPRGQPPRPPAGPES
jgi:polyhydroxyalkanoate synthesis regulator phasin